MKYLVLGLLLSGAFATKLTLADDITWVQLDPWFRYKDGKFSCSDSTDPSVRPMYLVAQVNSAMKVVYADFRETTFTLALRQIVFTANEMSEIKLEQDLLGDYVVKSLPLSARLINWLFFNMAPNTDILGFHNRFDCRPSNALATLSPNKAVFNFTRQGANSLYSPFQKFEGTLIDGGEYLAKLGFTQSKLENP